MVKQWSKVKIKDIASIFGRIGFRGYTKSDIVKEGFGAISLSPSNIVNGNLNYDNCTYISWDKYEESPEIKIEKNDVLLVKTGSTYGKTAIVLDVVNPMTVNPQIVIFKNIKISNLLFSYILKHRNFQNQINEIVVGGAIPTLSQKQIENFEIFIPIDNAEQKQIAKALSNVDELISNQEKLIEKKKAIKQGVMQELLTGKKRLDGFCDKWHCVKLGNVSSICTGDKNNEQSVEFGKYPFFVRSQKVERINTYSFNGEAILIPGEGNIGNIFHYINGKFDWHQRVYKISDFSEIVYGKYVFYNMKLMFGDYALKNTVKATVDSLRLSTFEEYEMFIPTNINEQKAIANVLTDIDKEIFEQEQKLEKYKQLKQAMMEQLLTGKIRLV